MTPEQQPNSGPHGQSHQGPGPPSQSVRTSNFATGLSSHSSSRKRFGSANFDRSAYTAGQTLVTVVNDPRADAAKSWGAWLGFRVPDISWQDPPPPIDTMRYPPVSRRDFAKYLALISDGSYEQFEQTRQSFALGGIPQQLMTFGADSADMDIDDPSSYGVPYEGYVTAASAAVLGTPHQLSEASGSFSRRSNVEAPGEPPSPPSESSQHRPLAASRLKQGDGLVTALQVVPPLFFNEDFSLSRPDIFEAICGCEDDNEMYARIDKLNAALDVVETQLMREIASRSGAIVAAGNCVHDLHRRLSITLAHIKRLRENVSDMDDVTYSAAVRVAQLQRRRNNLSATVEQVKALEEVAAAKAALPLLVESGDYAGALELLENLNHAAAGLSSTGVAALRALPPQLAETRSVVESLLQSEMLGAAMYTDAHVVLERAVADSARMLGLAAATAPLGTLSPVDNSGVTSAVGPPSPSSSSSSDPLSREGSLRSSGSSALLAAELAAAHEQLHDRLLPVVLGLHRCDRLEAALRQFAVNRAAEVKAIVREVVERLLPQHLQLAGIAVDGDVGGILGVGPGAAGVAATAVADGGSGSGVEMSLAEKLAVLPHLGFIQILMVINSMVEAYLAHTLLVGSLVESVLRNGSRVAPAALAAPRREVYSALQAVVDVATGRWAKLMAARSDVHSRLKVYEFRGLLSVCELFAGLPDLHGLRPGAALRPTLQALCRAHLENTHARCATQMQHLLEAEQWVPAEAHASFQAIVDRLEERCPGARPSSTQRQTQPTLSEDGKVAAQQAGSAAGQSGSVMDRKAVNLGRSTEGLLRLGGRHYWPVNALLMLLKLLDEHYMGLLPSSLQPAAAGTTYLRGQGLGHTHSIAPQAASWALSTVGPDVAQRCLELLRTFNTVTAQQVLGAGAMRTAGLKSISAKHLALAAQSLAALLAVLPLLRWQLAAAIMDTARRVVLMPEFDRLAQDLNLHVEEIHGKLVDIMQDRVLAACRQVSADSEAWVRAAPSLQAQQAVQPMPSEALRLLARQLGTLRSVLQPILQPEEVSYIFGRVAAACSESLAGLLDNLTPPMLAAAAAPLPPSGTSGLLRGLGGGGATASAAAAAAAAAVAAQAAVTAAWEASRRTNALFMLEALATLPLDPSRASSYVTRLATFYTKHYGLIPSLTTTPAATAALAAPALAVSLPPAVAMPEATQPVETGAQPAASPAPAAAAAAGVPDAATVSALQLSPHSAVSARGDVAPSADPASTASAAFLVPVTEVPAGSTPGSEDEERSLKFAKDPPTEALPGEIAAAAVNGVPNNDADSGESFSAAFTGQDESASASINADSMHVSISVPSLPQQQQQLLLLQSQPLGHTQREDDGRSEIAGYMGEEHRDAPSPPPSQPTAQPSTERRLEQQELPTASAVEASPPSPTPESEQKVAAGLETPSAAMVLTVAVNVESTAAVAGGSSDWDAENERTGGLPRLCREGTHERGEWACLSGSGNGSGNGGGAQGSVPLLTSSESESMSVSMPEAIVLSGQQQGGRNEGLHPGSQDMDATGKVTAAFPEYLLPHSDGPEQKAKQGLPDHQEPQEQMEKEVGSIVSEAPVDTVSIEAAKITASPQLLPTDPVPAPIEPPGSSVAVLFDPLGGFEVSYGRG